MERFLVIVEEAPECDTEHTEVELGTYAKFWVIDKNGDRVETEPPVIQLDVKRLKAEDFVLIYIMFYLHLWPSQSLDRYEENVLHEFLHVRHPEKSEKWIRQKTNELLKT